MAYPKQFASGVVSVNVPYQSNGCSLSEKTTFLSKSDTLQELNLCILYAKYYIYIPRLINNNTHDLYNSLTQLKLALQIK